MGIKTAKIDIHWNYFLAIESDLEKISKYVEFDERNFGCFSIEISRILLASAAEVDVVCKQICRQLDPNSKADNINHYHNEIRATYPLIKNFEVLIPRYGLTLRPWSNWRNRNGVPLWWTAYNKIKHHRHLKYGEANLKNALNSVAGLYVMVLYLYKDKAEMGELIPSPQLFRPGEKHFRGVTHGGYEFGINYEL